MKTKTYAVGVFEHVRKTGRIWLQAYTRYFNPTWEGCCVHTVTTDDGAYAKELAKAEHRRKCMKDRPLKGDAV